VLGKDGLAREETAGQEEKANGGATRHKIRF
jgi:hypothetical protein